MRGAPLRIIQHPLQVHLGEGTDEGRVDYPAAVAKLIPGEVVAAYLACRSLLAAYNGPDNMLLWWIFVTVVCFVAVLGLRAWATSDKSAAVPIEWSAVVVAALSFLVWVYSFGDAFKMLGWWNQIGSGLILILWTLVAPLILMAWDRFTKKPA